MSCLTFFASAARSLKLENLVVGRNLGNSTLHLPIHSSTLAPRS